MHSPDITQENIEKIGELFPGCVKETKDSDGNSRLAIDFDRLKLDLGDASLEGVQEWYQLQWPGKAEARAFAGTPTSNALRPKRDESVQFDKTKNLFIEGDNLEALKLLRDSYLGKVKLIYIDPPYNTGKDFVYRDNYADSKEDFLVNSSQTDSDGSQLVANRESEGRFHSRWLSNLYSRLLVARNLLREDGIVVISIDEKEHANLKKLCDEVFGASNFCGEIVWKNSSKNDQSYVSIQHEYLVVYVRDKEKNNGDWTERKQGLEEIYRAFDEFKKAHGDDWAAIHKAALDWYKNFPPSNPISDSKHYNWMDERGVYFPDNIAGPNDGQYVYDVMHPVTGQVCKPPSTGWRFPEETLKQRIKENRVHFGKDHTTVPNNKTYLENTENQSLTSMRYVDGRAASNRLKDMFGKKIFTNPKDEILLAELFKAMNVMNDDIVIDFFAGSATTAHAVFELNRMQGSECQFILVQYPEDLNETLKVATGGAKKVTKNAIKFLNDIGRPVVISEIAKERIRRAAAKVSESMDNPENHDFGFRVLDIDTSNMQDVFYTPDQTKQSDLLTAVDNIKPDRSDEDLLFHILSTEGVDLHLPIEATEIQGRKVFFVDDNALVACFESGVTEELVTELANREPLRIVFRDNGFVSDSVKINVEQIFKQLSPMTDVKAL